jgi:hypothetical protein
MNSSRRQFLVGGSALLASSLSFGLESRAENDPALNHSPDSPIASVRILGNQFLDNKVGVTGADGATSTVLPAGDALWMFGDTVEGPFKTIRGLALTNLRSNTGAIVPKQDASQGIKNFKFLTDDSGMRPKQLVPFAKDESPAANRIWAIHGTAVESQIYLFYHRITLLKNVDVFVNFQLDGMGIAKADANSLAFSRLPAPDGSTLFWKGSEPSFGVWINRADDYVYLWGCLMTGMYLARTRPQSISDLSSYEYLAAAPKADEPTFAPRWSSRFQPNGALFDSVPNEMSVSFNSHLNRFIAFHSLQRAHKIVLRTAEKLTGPWSDPQVVFRPQRIGDDDLIYAAKEHPELARENGRVLYVTFVNSATYIPQLIEITLN